MRRSAFEREVRRRLGEARAPGEAVAGERARAVVQAAFAEAGRPAPDRRRPGLRRGALLAAATLAVLGGVLTPPGQAVGEWLRDAVRPRAAPRPAPGPPPIALPGPGRLLVRDSGTIWTLAPDGKPRRLGRYRDATWSAAGRFAAVTTGRALLAVDPRGRVRWSIAPPAPPRSPRWSPDGFRVAYLAGAQLRVVVADGTDDRLFRGHVRPVAPAFRPGAGRTVAWVDLAGEVRLADVDVARLAWRSPPSAAGAIRALSWSPDGRRLLAAHRRAITIYDVAGGGRGRTTRLARGRRLVAAAFPPRGGGRPALLERRGRRSSLRLLGGAAPLLEGTGHYDALQWSPDGRHLLVSWREADQWLVVRPEGAGNVTATASLTGRFGPAGSPRPLAWCCAGSR